LEEGGKIMGVVKITEDYRVEVAETGCLIIRKRMLLKSKTTGEISEVWESESYFSTWSEVFSKLIKIFVAKKIEEKKIVEMKELRNIYAEVRKEIINLLEFQ
jgi:hypothetical protein